METDTQNEGSENVEHKCNEIREFLRSHGMTVADFKAKLEENTALLKEIEKALEEREEIDEGARDLVKMNAEAITQSGEIMNQRDHWMKLLLEKQREKEELLRRYVDLSISFENERVDRATKEIMRHQVEFRRWLEQESGVRNESRQKLVDKVAMLKDTISSLEGEIELKKQSHLMLQDELKKLQEVKMMVNEGASPGISTKRTDPEPEEEFKLGFLNVENIVAKTE